MAVDPFCIPVSTFFGSRKLNDPVLRFVDSSSSVLPYNRFLALANSPASAQIHLVLPSPILDDFLDLRSNPTRHPTKTMSTFDLMYIDTTNVGRHALPTSATQCPVLFG
jgi:hypothetical protein